MSKRIELEGKVFGELTVVRPASKDLYGHSRWVCLCSCGKECTVSTTNLRTKHSTSCGHLKRFRLRDYVRANGPTNVKHADPMTKMHNSVLRSYRYGATSRGLDWNLTREQALQMILGNCHFCGSPPNNLKKRCSGGSTERPFLYNGLDRLDSAQGYYPENVVTCCRICNRAKSDLPLPEFREWLSRIAERHSV